MNCSASERDILLYNYCRSSVVVVQMRFKINDSLLYRSAPVSVVSSHFWRLLKSEEEDKEDKEDKKEDKKEETLETKMSECWRIWWKEWKKVWKKRNSSSAKKQKKKRANFNKTNAKTLLLCQQTLFCRSHHHPTGLNYKTAKTRKLKLKLLYLKLW